MPTQENQTKISGYRELSEEELALVNSLKETANRIGALVDALEKDSQLDQRWISIGRTHLQQGFMGLIRGVTQPRGF